MTNRKQPNFIVFSTLTILLAFLIRFINLGSPTLTDYEATWALQALHLSQGTHSLLGSQAAYLQLTALFFNLFGTSTFVARLLPALFGSLLVLIPLLLQSELGQIPALILAFFFAIDPGFLAVSRSVGSPIIGLTCLGLALTLWYYKHPRWAGVFLGLGLLGGASLWAGVVGMAIALGLLRLIHREAFDTIIAQFKPETQSTVSHGEDIPADSVESRPGIKAWLPLIISTAATAFLVGTLCFIRPAGITGLASGLTDYLTGWGKSSGVSPLYLLLALAIYEPIALILGIWGGVRGWMKKDPLAQFMGLWAIVALLLALLYWNREVDSLVWVILPLWFLAVRELMLHFAVRKEEVFNTTVQAIISFLMLGFCAVNVLGMVANFTLDSTSGSQHLVMVLVAVIILILVSFLISWGWNPRITEHGLVWGIGLILLLYTFSAAIEAGNIRPEFTSELWTRGQSLPEVNVLVNTINQLSDTAAGTRNDLSIDIVGIKSSGLEWALRSFNSVTFENGLAQGAKPAIVITVDTAQPTLAAAYSGNRMEISQETNWSDTFTSDQFLPWAVYHKASQTLRMGILWARTDLFPGGATSTISNSNQ